MPTCRLSSLHLTLPRPLALFFSNSLLPGAKNIIAPNLSC